jgi:hypothetical protein
MLIRIDFQGYGVVVVAYAKIGGSFEIFITTAPDMYKAMMPAKAPV